MGKSTEKLEKELGAIGIALQDGQLGLYRFDEIDYADKWNVRDPKLYADRVPQKLGELEADGMIRTPLVAVRLVGMTDDQKPILVVGHIRVRAVAMMETMNPALFKSSFSKIPVIVIPNVTEDQRRRLVLDHGSEIALREDEVYKEYKRLCRCGYGQKQISNMLSKLFYRLASSKNQTVFDKRQAEFRRTGSFLIGKSEFTNASDVAHQTWRGHMQYFERLMKAPKCVEGEWLAYMSGDANAVYPDRAWVQVLVKLDPREAQAAIDEKRAAKGDKKKSAKLVWGAARLIQARSACQSRYYQTQLDAALGREEAATKLPDLEDELVMFERALEIDASRVWGVLDEIIASAPEPEPETVILEDEE
jgi:hypothetical protein